MKKIVIPFLVAVVLLCLALNVQAVRPLPRYLLAPGDTLLDMTSTVEGGYSVYCIGSGFWLRRILGNPTGNPGRRDLMGHPIHVDSGPGIYFVGGCDTLICRAHTDTIWVIPHE